jgi:hypothetical protein
MDNFSEYLLSHLGTQSYDPPNHVAAVAELIFRFAAVATAAPNLTGNSFG